MKTIMSEKNIVVALFIMVFITFSLAHEDSKKMERAYSGIHSTAISQILIPPQQPQDVLISE